MSWVRWAAPSAIVISIAAPAHAYRYLSVEQAQKLAFPDAQGRQATGMTGSDGVFHLTTNAPGDGAIPGDYKVVVRREKGRVEWTPELVHSMAPPTPGGGMRARSIGGRIETPRRPASTSRCPRDRRPTLRSRGPAPGA